MSNFPLKLAQDRSARGRAANELFSSDAAVLLRLASERLAEYVLALHAPLGHEAIGVDGEGERVAEIVARLFQRRALGGRGAPFLDEGHVAAGHLLEDRGELHGGTCLAAAAGDAEIIGHGCSPLCGMVISAPGLPVRVCAPPRRT